MFPNASQVGADVKAWFGAMPRQMRMLPQKRPLSALPLLVGGSSGGSGSAAAGVGIVGGGGGIGGGILPSAVARTMTTAGGGLGTTIDHYYLSRHCAVCDELTRVNQSVCDRCAADPQAAAASLIARTSRLERQHRHMARICLHCSGGGSADAPHGGIACDSLDCGVYYERRKLAQELASMSALTSASLARIDRSSSSSHNAS